MHIDLTGRTALVSASTAGIGFAIAKGLARAGAHTIINGRTEASVVESLDALRESVPNAEVRGVAGDVSTSEGVAKLVHAVPAVDILVNNAGIYGPELFFEISDETWERFFQVNVMSGVRLARHYLRGMLERNAGRVVFISSESALNIPADMIHYGMTKTAQLSIARGLAKLAAGTDVTVNSVLPGPTLSDGVKSMLEDRAAKEGKSIDEVAVEFVREHRASSILRRPATVDEVANLVVYVCSPYASATTGAALRVDGGVVDSIV